MTLFLYRRKTSKAAKGVLNERNRLAVKSSRGRLHSPPLSHHRAYGSRTTAVPHVKTFPTLRSVSNVEISPI